MSNPDIGTCPYCSEEKNIACAHCGFFQSECECGSEARFCYICQEEFMIEEPQLFDIDELGSGSETVHNEHADTEPAQTVTKKCDRHWFQPVDLGGVTVYCSTLNNDRKGGGVTVPKPGFGIYADYKWDPDWPAIIIDWPDFSIPKHYGTACEIISHAYKLAVMGHKIEMGCIGGHGRTGTILACMKMMHEKGGWNHEDVVKWVKENYCSHAVETADQTWFVAYFSGYWFNTEVPAKGKPKYTSTYSSKSTPSINPAGTHCSVAIHYAMMMRGHDKCFKNGSKCKWWSADVKMFSEASTTDPTLKLAIGKMGAFPLAPGGQKIESDSTHTFEQHAVMFEKGYETCPLYGDECGYWEEDYAKFSRDDFSGLDKEEADKALKDLSYLPKIDVQIETQDTTTLETEDTDDDFEF